MPNKNYVKGRRKEYKIMSDLKEIGYDIAQRSAGSHSPIDVFGIKLNEKKIIFLQSKPEDYKSNKYSEFIEKLNGTFEVEFKII